MEKQYRTTLVIPGTYGVASAQAGAQPSDKFTSSRSKVQRHAKLVYSPVILSNIEKQSRTTAVHAKLVYSQVISIPWSRDTAPK
jgi:hypothetical protein